MCIKENLYLCNWNIFNIFTSFIVNNEFEKWHTFESDILNIYGQFYLKSDLMPAFNSKFL